MVHRYILQMVGWRARKVDHGLLPSFQVPQLRRFLSQAQQEGRWWASGAIFHLNGHEIKADRQKAGHTVILDQGQWADVKSIKFNQFEAELRRGTAHSA